VCHADTQGDAASGPGPMPSSVMNVETPSAPAADHEAGITGAMREICCASRIFA